MAEGSLRSVVNDIKRHRPDQSHSSNCRVSITTNALNVINVANQCLCRAGDLYRPWTMRRLGVSQVLKSEGRRGARHVVRSLKSILSSSCLTSFPETENLIKHLKISILLLL